MNDPIILALDTSGPHCSVALRKGAHQWAMRHEDMKRGQAEKLVPLIEEMFEEEGVSWSDLGLIAVGIGPGNFTGIRIGVSFARGCVLGLKIPAMGVSTFEIMRGSVAAHKDSKEYVSVTGPRDTLYMQEFFEGSPCNSPFISDWLGTGINLDPDTVVEFIGHHVSDIPALLQHRGSEETAYQNVKAYDGRILDFAPTIAKIAAQRWKLGETSPDRPAPLYVKAADAAPPRDPAPVILP